MRTEDTETNGEPTDERAEERTTADPIGVETPDWGLTERGASRMIGAASDRTTRADQQRGIREMGPVGIAHVTGSLGRSETWAATVSDDLEHQ